MTRWGRSAERLMGNSQRVNYTVFQNGNVDDIIKVILFADQMGREFTQQFAEQLRGPTEMKTLENVWDFVKDNIRYQVDKSGHEKIKSPGATWKDKYGDCKSHTVLVGSLLHNLGFDFNYKLVFFDPAFPQLGHIYSVVKLNGRDVIIDTVNKKFNKEEPYWKAYEYSPETGRKVQVSGISKNSWIGTGLLAGFLFWVFKNLSND